MITQVCEHKHVAMTVEDQEIWLNLIRPGHMGWNDPLTFLNSVWRAMRADEAIMCGAVFNESL